MTKAVIFDFGGVIIPSPIGAFSALEANFHLPAGTIVSLNMENHHDNAWAKFERAEVSQAGFIHLFNKEAEEYGVKIDIGDLFSDYPRPDPHPEMISALGWLKGRYKMALLTNNFATSSNRIALEPILEYFDVVVESSQVGMRKPEEQIYQHTLDLLKADAKEAIFLDDLGINLKPAYTMGIQTIKVSDPTSALEALWEMLGDHPPKYQSTNG